MDPNIVSLISVGVSALTVIILLVLISKVARLSKQIPGTGATAKEIGEELGGSIQSSFEKFMPQPEKVADAITSAVESSLKSAGAGLGDVEKAIASAATGLGSGLSDGSDKLKSSLIDGSAKLESTLTGGSEKLQATFTDGSTKLQTTFSEGSESLSATLTGGSEKLQAAFNDGSEKMTAALTNGSKSVSDALSSGSSNLESALKEHAEKTAQANKELSSQLEKIATLEKEIDKLLHIQEATEGTLKSVTATSEFKDLVSGLRTHLESSDKVLKELTKPRQIRLVEEE